MVCTLNETTGAPKHWLLPTKKKKKKEKGLESCSGGGVGAKLNQKLISFKQEVHTELKPFPEVNIS